MLFERHSEASKESPLKPHHQGTVLQHFKFVSIQCCICILCGPCLMTCGRVRKAVGSEQSSSMPRLCCRRCNHSLISHVVPILIGLFLVDVSDICFDRQEPLRALSVENLRFHISGGPRAHFSYFLRNCPQNRSREKVGAPQTTSKISIRICLLSSPVPLSIFVMFFLFGGGREG